MKHSLINNRQHFYELLSNNSFAIIHSGYAPHKTADANYNFVVNNNFYYLTGIDQEDVILVIGKFDNQYFERLFIVPVDPYWAKWLGATLTKEEASEISGIDTKNIVDRNNFSNVVSSLYQSNRYGLNEAHVVYLDLEQRNVPLYNTFALEYAKELNEKYPYVSIKNCYNLIIQLRMCKNESEVALIKESIKTTKNAIYRVMNHHNELSNEAIAQAHFDFGITAEGKVISFNDIVAAGKNATVLHYDDNNQPIEKDSLLLMDVGCYTKHYSSDITRTFPTTGKFTKRQKEVYEVVLDCNKKCIEYATDGMSWKEINDYAKEILAKGCIKLGLIKEESELNKYYYHSIGHSLGLDVHDPSKASDGLKEGMVITIEPGLYIAEEGIGIRIEDNILITKGKAINLSHEIIKEVKDIEEFMK